MQNHANENASKGRYALGLYKLHTIEAYDHNHDPEVIFETITTWLTDGEAKNVTDGARRYHAECWNCAGDEDSVREAFYKGKKL